MMVRWFVGSGDSWFISDTRMDRPKSRPAVPWRPWSSESCFRGVTQLTVPYQTSTTPSCPQRTQPLAECRAKCPKRHWRALRCLGGRIFVRNWYITPAGPQPGYAKNHQFSQLFRLFLWWIFHATRLIHQRVYVYVGYYLYTEMIQRIDVTDCELMLSLFVRKLSL